jgi:molecular chaperone GrpE (heat shock protein)
MSDEVLRQISALGKGLIQINTKLGRLTQLVEGPRSAGPDVLEPLLDLISALDDALRSRPDAGIRVARDAAIDALAARDIVPVPDRGPFDARHHAAVGEAPGEVPGQVAETVRRGWLKRGDPPTVLRVAEVNVTTLGAR